MQQGFLADHRVHQVRSKRHMHDIATNDTNALCETDTAREVSGRRGTMRIQFDTGYDCAVFMSKIARRSAQACAEIGHFAAASNMSARGKGIDYGQTAIVILIEREQVFRRKCIEMPAPGSYGGKDLFTRNRMAAVEGEDMILIVHCATRAPG
jgi:hypothetical protein